MDARRLRSDGRFRASTGTDGSAADGPSARFGADARESGSRTFVRVHAEPRRFRSRAFAGFRTKPRQPERRTVTTAGDDARVTERHLSVRYAEHDAAANQCAAGDGATATVIVHDVAEHDARLDAAGAASLADIANHAVNVR
jgi:hypothetical protein